MSRKILLSFGIVVMAVGLCFAEDTKLEFEGRYWVTDLNAKAKVVKSEIGSDFDFKSDLGVADEDFPEARVIWNTTKNSQIRLAYTQVAYSGHKDIETTIQFAGQSYTLGTRVDSDFDLQYLRLGWIWKFMNMADDKIRLGLLVEAKGLLADISLKAPVLSISESEQVLGGLPTIGAVLDINPMKKLNLFAEISGIGAGNLGYFFDAEAGAKIILFKNFSVAAGYRIIDVKIESSPDFLKARLTGPFARATLRF
ncbi:MAG: hypothetical protein V1674_04095 [Candidatus Omnitrophota bacterium]